MSEGLCCSEGKLAMAQCAMQMRAVVSLGDVGVLGVESRTVGAASRLASVSQGWRAANVAQLRVAAAGRVELQRQYNLVAGMDWVGLHCIRGGWIMLDDERAELVTGSG